MSSVLTEGILSVLSGRHGCSSGTVLLAHNPRRQGPVASAAAQVATGLVVAHRRAHQPGEKSACYVLVPSAPLFVHPGKKPVHARSVADGCSLLSALHELIGLCLKTSSCLCRSVKGAAGSGAWA